MVQNAIVQQQGGVRPVRPKVHCDGLPLLKGGASIHDEGQTPGQDVFLQLPLRSNAPLVLHLHIPCLAHLQPRSTSTGVRWCAAAYMTMGQLLSLNVAGCQRRQKVVVGLDCICEEGAHCTLHGMLWCKAYQICDGHKRHILAFQGAMDVGSDYLHRPDHVIEGEDVFAEECRVLLEDICLEFAVEPLEELPAGLEGGQLMAAVLTSPRSNHARQSKLQADECGLACSPAG